MNRKRIFIVFFMFFIIIGCNKQNYYTKDEELPTIVEMVNESMGKGYKNSFKKETIELTNECSRIQAQSATKLSYTFSGVR